MIGNAIIFEPALASSLRHHLQRFRTVGGSGVRVEDAAEILVTDEHGKLLFRRALDLAPALTQFRRDKLQAERFVDRFLRRRRYYFFSPVQPVRPEIETFPRGVIFELLKMLRRSGRSQQACPEMLFITDRQPEAGAFNLRRFLRLRDER